MAEGILGLGQGQAASLNSDMLEKLKAVDRKATVAPIEKKLEKFESEKKVISDVTTKVNELFDAVKVFSLNQSTGTNAFQQKSANVSGDGVVFDSDDLSALKTGSLRVEVKELAQKDVWQSNPISGLKTDTVNAGIITINGTNIDTSTMSYTELTEEINKISGVQASLVDSSDGKFRLAIKSTETGTANKINFNTKDISGNDLGVSSGAAKLFGNIAQKDVWQSNPISGLKTDTVNAGIITINGTNIDTSTMSYTKLTEEINKISGVQASLVGSDGNFKLSIQSTETGADKKIDFNNSSGSVSAGALALFGTNDKLALDKNLNVVEAKDNTIYSTNNVLKAQDMQLKADGVDYSSSSNTITIDGLKITATKETGDSTINIENDTTTLSAQMKNFADKFNELRATIENEIYSADASVDNKGALRDMLATIKNELFGTGSGDKSIFSFGFSLDEKSGDILFNQKDFEASIKNGTADLEALFAGSPNKKGIATSMDEAISVSGVTKNLLDYEINMLEREERLKKDKETAETTLDNKYSLMAQQFASYGVMINQMESSFSGLKMLILQSQASR
ncbi:flagellar filament capping protein FliD [Aliarcobacter cryaerophilus]|uniref:flagellar filament capping protein FliD n=1 Tax=Aliarcobacter cryaerophilus TaxID=28198 RepID=UPI0021B6858C|nr:flagellar filament capping protein FliD [Aliarcobacter cryaerophilus]MCT7519338.1 flagellar filament capping protein FliD [Aliarcobacter cryaerophilus]